MYRLIFILFTFSLVSCFPNNKHKYEKAEKAGPTVVVTTTMLGDLVKQIGGTNVNVVTIMKPGGDPHLYQPTPNDAKAIATSQLVVTSGLHLEGWIDDLIRNAGGERPIVVGAENIEPIRMKDSPGGVDPHFWFDLNAWNTAAKNVADGLKKVVPDSGHPSIEKNLADYTAQVEATNAWVKERLASIPESQRVLVTSHDAFHYFGRSYGVEVVAIQGVSTEQEASDRDVVNVIETIKAKNVPAVFVESSVNPALIKQVAKETGVKVAGPLYSDSIGTADSKASTFLGTVRENTRMITEALGGKFVAFDFKREERTQ